MTHLDAKGLLRLELILADLRSGLARSVAFAAARMGEEEQAAFVHEHELDLAAAEAEFERSWVWDATAKAKTFDDSLKMLERRRPKRWASLEARSKARELAQPKQPIAVLLAQQQAVDAEFSRWEPLELPGHEPGDDDE